MECLAFGDTHADKDVYDILKNKVKLDQPDFSICIGDFTIFEHDLKKNMRKLSKLGKLFLVHGNHEEEIIVRKLAKEYDNIDFIHEKILIWKNTMFIGWGGGGFTEKEFEFEQWIKQNKKKIRQFNGTKIFIAHAPFYNTKLDELDQGHHGNKSFTNFIKKYKIDYAFCGHFHENNGKMDMIKHCKCYNPGPKGMFIKIR